MARHCCCWTVAATIVLLLLIILLATEWYFWSSEQCDGQCVPMNKCKNRTWTYIDVRAGHLNEHCDHYLDVCCSTEFVVSNETVLPVAENSSTPAEFKPCGIRNENGISFTITHATHNEAQFAEFPWMVALYVRHPINLTAQYYRCGGSLIRPGVVLTAAHGVIVSRETTLVARAGDWDTETESETFPFQERRVSSVVIHPNYVKGSVRNNIALLLLEQPFHPAENVQLVCLPPQDTIIIEQNCFATGWGRPNFDSTYRQKILKKRRLPIVPSDSCESTLRSTKLRANYSLHKSLICAGGEKGHDTCLGDGGSPLVCPIPGSYNRYHQAGIVVGGIGCGQEGIPALYTRSSLFTDWILEELGERPKQKLLR